MLIIPHYGVVPAICKHIPAENALPCKSIAIRIDKPTGFGVIVSALEVVQPRLRVIDIPAVAEGVEFAQCVGHGAGGGQRITPGIVGVRHHLRAAAVDQPGHIALRILQVEVLRAIVGDGHGTNFVVGEVQGSAAGGRVNVDLRQRVTEVGVACPRSLARVDDLAAGIADVIDARIVGVWRRCSAPCPIQLDFLTRSFMDATGNTKEQRYLLEPTIPQFCIFPMMYASKSDHFTG